MYVVAASVAASHPAGMTVPTCRGQKGLIFFGTYLTAQEMTKSENNGLAI